MRVGYLHIGNEGGGVRRYGLMIAQAARQRSDIEVIEADGGGRDGSKPRLTEAARALAGADVVHIQWKPNDWGRGRVAFGALRAFAKACGRPMVVTLHDVWERHGIRERWLETDAHAIRWLGRNAARLTVHAREERRRLGGSVPDGRVVVVPHFVEERTMADAGASRAALGLTDKRAITVLGWMVRRKGYRLTVDALPLLPDDVVAVFAGAPITGREERATELKARAVELGVSDRLVITGYISDERLDQALAATAVACCPFSDLSASGSLSTWISTGRPIVTSDLPQFREYDEMVPGALRIFSPRTAEALAAAVRAVLDNETPVTDPKVVELAAQLSPARTVERFVEVYRAAAGR